MSGTNHYYIEMPIGNSRKLDHTNESTTLYVGLIDNGVILSALVHGEQDISSLELAVRIGSVGLGVLLKGRRSPFV